MSEVNLVNNNECGIERNRWISKTFGEKIRHTHKTKKEKTLKELENHSL